MVEEFETVYDFSEELEDILSMECSLDLDYFSISAEEY